MIQIFLSINNNEEVMQLPVPPANFTIPSPWKNEQIDGLQQTLNLIGIKGLKNIEIQSYFPSRDYPWLQNRTMWGMEYVDVIERWRERRVPIRIIIVNTDGKNLFNSAVTIDEFEHGMKQDGDIYYTMELTEFPFVNTRR